jgi:hypothetical protein
MFWLRLIFATLIGALAAAATYLIFLVGMLSTRPFHEFLSQLLVIGLACLAYGIVWVLPSATILSVLKVPASVSALLIVALCFGLSLHISAASSSELLSLAVPGVAGGLGFVAVQYCKLICLRLFQSGNRSIR